MKLWRQSFLVLAICGLIALAVMVFLPALAALGDGDHDLSTYPPPYPAPGINLPVMVNNASFQLPSATPTSTPTATCTPTPTPTSTPTPTVTPTATLPAYP